MEKHQENRKECRKTWKKIKKVENDQKFQKAIKTDKNVEKPSKILIKPEKTVKMLKNR